jgi:hypothetical protein
MAIKNVVWTASSRDDLRVVLMRYKTKSGSPFGAPETMSRIPTRRSSKVLVAQVSWKLSLVTARAPIAQSILLNSLILFMFSMFFKRSRNLELGLPKKKSILSKSG